MKKIGLMLGFLILLSHSGYSQDSTKVKIKKASEAIGNALDTAVKKTGHFFKKTSSKVGTLITSSQDKSMQGPHGEKVYNGPRGGKYYLDSEGVKVYLKPDQPEPEN